ncbi:MAG: hypothetical protein HQ495_10915 [Alphaproteobacteria bacterium]|nr:hypothetical protein [Alphaproteobacteria bacterium]
MATRFVLSGPGLALAALLAAAFFAWVLLKEGMQVQPAIGGGAVLAGILLARERPRAPLLPL